MHTDDLRTSAVLQPLENLQALRVAQRQSLPNHVHPSDHLPVGAVLVGRAEQVANGEAGGAAAAAEAVGGAAGGSSAVEAVVRHAEAVVAKRRCSVCGVNVY